MIKISVIMPVYNSEEYLVWAASSVLNQSLKEIELILIDDGSIDRSGNICDEMVRKDARVKVMHQKNQGISAARNQGIKLATGEYIAFIDNDDIYLEGFLEKIYKYAQSNHADVVKYGYRVIEDWNKDENSARIKTFSETKKIEFKDPSQDYQNLKNDGFFNMIWNGLYRREIIIKNNIFFPEDVKKGYEDWIFNYELLSCTTENIYVWEDVEYNHYQRVSHSTSSHYHENQQMALLLAAQKEYELIKVLNQKLNSKIEWNKYAMEHFLEAVLMFERKGCDVSKKDKMKYLKKFRDMEEFRGIIQKSVRKNFSYTKKMVSFLLDKENYGILLTISHWYNIYIQYKRKKKYGGFN